MYNMMHVYVKIFAAARLNHVILENVEHCGGEPEQAILYVTDG